MAEPIPTPSSELDAPCVHVLGTDRWGGEAVSVRELAQELVAAASANAADATSSTAHACQGWTVYVPPSTAADATPLDKLCDVEELGEMDAAARVIQKYITGRQAEQQSMNSMVRICEERLVTSKRLRYLSE